MRYLTLGEVVRLHQMVIEQSGGASGVRDLSLLDSALAQPRATFGGQDLHPSLIHKAAALCASLVQNHAFLDGNKRVGHAAMATFLSSTASKLTRPLATRSGSSSTWLPVP